MTTGKGVGRKNSGKDNRKTRLLPLAMTDRRQLHVPSPHKNDLFWRKIHYAYFYIILHFRAQKTCFQVPTSALIAPALSILLSNPEQVTAVKIMTVRVAGDVFAKQMLVVQTLAGSLKICGIIQLATGTILLMQN